MNENRPPYIFHTDPGHGWLEVTREECKELGILDEISGYSYQDGPYVLLEEDCDAPLFVRAWERKHGPLWKTQVVLERYEEWTWVRGLPHFDKNRRPSLDRVSR